MPNEEYLTFEIRITTIMEILSSSISTIGILHYSVFLPTLIVIFKIISRTCKLFIVFVLKQNLQQFNSLIFRISI